MRILIAPDKFKGTLSALDAAKAIAHGWQRARPDDNLDLLPITDGGDGFGSVMSELLKARTQQIKTVDAAHRPIRATWWWNSKSKTAVIESANVIGLAMLPRGQFHPFQLDTFGLGSLLLRAQSKSARQIIIGIGGSATNDGGFGLARALGWEFLDKQARPIESWTQLHKLASVRKPQRMLRGEILVAVDVKNHLLGARGATRVFGPQKGLRAEDFAHAERCLGQLRSVLKRQLRLDFANTPGAGAAGGLGFGLATFAGAKLQSGFNLFADYARLDRILRNMDLVVTGEGAIDDSTLMGKGVGEIARRCRTPRLPCIGLAGAIAPSPTTKKMFSQTLALTELTSSKEAMRNPSLWLARAAEKVAENLVCNRRARR